MKKNRFFLAFTALILCSSMSAFAQTHFGLRLGGALPMGDFAEAKVTKSSGVQKWAPIDEDGKYGGATFGFNIGAFLKFDIPSVEGLGVIASLDFIYNEINSEIKDYFEEELKEEEITFPKYLNIPIMVGANYTYQLSNVIGIYGEAALGLNFRKITKMSVSWSFDDEYGEHEGEQEMTYDNASSFTFRIGGGFIFNDRFTVGIDYYALGSEKAKGDFEGEDGNASKFSSKALSTNMLLIRLGIMF